ncbi:MAG: hypothetical protein AAF438_20510 [Pseudomonadota bacterium]
MTLSSLSPIPPLLMADIQYQPAQEALKAICLRTQDKAIAEALIEKGSRQVTGKLIGELAGHFDRQTVEELLIKATERSDLASTALLHMGEAQTPSSRRFLTRALSGPNGASAASALARYASTTEIDSVGQLLLDPSTTPMGQTNALLTLKLSPHQQIARTYLEQAAKQTSLNSRVRKKVQQWLTK